MGDRRQGSRGAALHCPLREDRRTRVQRRTHRREFAPPVASPLSSRPSRRANPTQPAEERELRDNCTDQRCRQVPALEPSDETAVAHGAHAIHDTAAQQALRVQKANRYAVAAQTRNSPIDCRIVLLCLSTAAPPTGTDTGPLRVALRGRVLPKRPSSGAAF